MEGLDVAPGGVKRGRDLRRQGGHREGGYGQAGRAVEDGAIEFSRQVAQGGVAPGADVFDDGSDLCVCVREREREREKEREREEESERGEESGVAGRGRERRGYPRLFSSHARRRAAPP